MHANPLPRAGKPCTAWTSACGFALVLVVLSAVGPASRAQAPRTEGFEAPATEEAEIALALSACPESVADGAAVYVLGKAGYVKVRDGRNGFTAIVQHALPRSQEPQCMDAEGTRTFLPRYLKVAELRAQGKTAEEIGRFVARAFETGNFQAPVRPGVDYMLSTQNYVAGPDGNVSHFPPHIMFYAPYLKNTDIGSPGLHSDLAFVAFEGSPQALIIVPVGSHGRAGDGGHPH
jgi:hypothetical protein